MSLPWITSNFVKGKIGKPISIDWNRFDKSKVKVFDFDRSDGYTISRIICTDWSKKLEAQGFEDNLAIYLQSENFSKFMLNCFTLIHTYGPSPF